MDERPEPVAYIHAVLLLRDWVCRYVRRNLDLISQAHSGILHGIRVIKNDIDHDQNPEFVR